MLSIIKMVATLVAIAPDLGKIIRTVLNYIHGSKNDEVEARRHRAQTLSIAIEHFKKTGSTDKLNDLLRDNL